MKHIKNIYDFTGEGGQERLRKHIDNVKSDPEYKAKWIEHRDLEIKKWWLTLKPFKDESDVPNLPKMDDFFIQRLKELGAIEKSKRDYDDVILSLDVNSVRKVDISLIKQYSK